MKTIKTLGNILWFIFIGLWGWISYTITGILLCILIITIPFGKQCFKLAKLVVMPFGKEVKSKFDSHPIANVLWLIFFGISFCIGYAFIGIVFCITIIGIPFGKQCFKLAGLSAIPFGATVK